MDGCSHCKGPQTGWFHSLTPSHSEDWFHVVGGSCQSLSVPVVPCPSSAALKSPAAEYVMCHGCKSPDTILSKENRLHFVRCEQVRSDPVPSQPSMCVAVRLFLLLPNQMLSGPLG